MRFLATVFCLVLAGLGLGVPNLSADPPATQPARDGIARALARLKGEDKERFRFAVLGDSQFRDDVRFEAVIARVQAHRPDLVLQVGDLIAAEQAADAGKVLAQWAAYQHHVRGLTAPFFPVPGNHDLGRTGAAEAWRQVWGPLRYSFDYSGCRFIVLNSEAGPDGGELLGRDQAAWLREQLAVKARHVFVFLHEPFWVWAADRWRPYHELFRNAPVRAVFAGHMHVYGHQRIDGIDYVVTVAVHPGPDNLPAGLMSHFIEADVDGRSVELSIRHAGGRLPLDGIDPAVQSAYRRVVLALGRLPATSPDEPARYRMTLTNPVNHPVTIEYRWEREGPGEFQVSPASGAVELAPEKEAQVALRVRPPATQPTRLPIVAARFPVRTRSGQMTTVELTGELPVAADLRRVNLPGRLVGRVVLVGQENQAGMSWLLSELGLAAKGKLLRAETLEELDKLWPDLRPGDLLVAAHMAFDYGSPFPGWFDRRHPDVGEFLRGGGRLFACLGFTDKSRPALALFGVGYGQPDRPWKTATRGDVHTLFLPGGRANLLAGGLIGDKVEFTEVAMFGGWLIPRQPDRWAVLGVDSQGRPVLLAQRMGKGLVVLSSALLTSPHHIRDNYNQQLIWPNLLTLDPSVLPGAR